jgi:two-component system, NarL family, nitrate/nitrite response regulator NarL
LQKLAAVGVRGWSAGETNGQTSEGSVNVGMKPLIRILLIDDHVVVRTGLRVLIESKPWMLVVGEADGRAEALTVVQQSQPDVILLDLDLGNESGLDLLPDLLHSRSGVRVLLFTGMRDPAIHRQAVRLGASGVVLKDTSLATVTKAIEKVYAGEVWLERSMVASVLNELVPRHGYDDSPAAWISALTTREREIIALIGEGLKNTEIASRLNLSEATVRNHLTSIFGKLRVGDRVELVVFAYRHRLARLPTS